MSITIVDHQLPFDTYNEYTVHIGNTAVKTLVTCCPHKLNEWLSKFQSYSNLLVGLDIEWLPNLRNQDNPTATLQLCVGQNCLIFQLLYCPTHPQSLFDFLEKEESTFFGVEIASDVKKLYMDYGLVVGGKVVDLRRLASEKKGDEGLKKAGVKSLARVVLGMEIVKPKSVSCSRWDQEWLHPEQVKYACVDAFLSYEIGRVLSGSGFRVVESRQLGLCLKLVVRLGTSLMILCLVCLLIIAFVDDS